MKKIAPHFLVLALLLPGGPARADELFWRLIAPPKFHEEIPFHEPVLDAEGKLLPWTSYDRVMALSMDFIAACPRDGATGLPWYEQYSDFRAPDMEPEQWPHNPAGLYGMMVETVARYWAYTGERKWIELARHPLDHLIAESTPPDFAWPRVPYASADNSGHYRGGSHEGIDGIEPDKVGQAGAGYVRFYQLTGEEKYLREAEHCAEVLAEKMRPGDARHSPWPFRVNARTGKALEEYTSEVIWPVTLFDELMALGRDREGKYGEAREAAWTWLMAYPMRTMKWKGYFEDVVRDPGNFNRDQYTPGEVARYLMRRPEADPEWRAHVPMLLGWIKQTLGDTRGKWRGATAVREQRFCMQVASSHTARYASLCAMWHAAGGGPEWREDALRSFALATYLSRGDGIVIFSIADPDVWFSDGYFDYVPHFLDGMGALPELAPEGEDHLLSSSTIIREVRYQPGRIEYEAFDAEGTETLRLSFIPRRVMAEGREMELRAGEGAGAGAWFDPALGALRVRRSGVRRIVIE
ncbi:MAG TPA: hypothetical protein VM658_02325 [bacterium]|nr:hypothetical protein [bacterium]